MTKKPKIVIGPTEIAGNVASLYKLLKGSGENTSLFLTKPHAHHESICFMQKYSFFVSNIKNNVLRKLMRLSEYLIQYCLGLYHICTKDVFIFYYGNTFLPKYIDLFILKIMGKVTIMVYCGADSRLPIIGVFIYHLNSNTVVKQCNKIISRLRIVEKYVTHIMVNPFSAQLHERKIINSLIMGLSYNLSQFKNHKLREKSTKKFRIIHAPSHILAKGTHEIRKIITGLKKQFPIDYIELIGVSHSEVAKNLQEADIVIDQLYLDGIMAGFGTEALMYEKPVFSGTYIHKKELQKYVDYPINYTVLFHPDKLKEVLINYLENPEKLKELEHNIKKYKAEYLNDELLINRWKKIIYGNYPKHWMVNPKLISYYQGVSLSKNILKKKLNELKVDFAQINLEKNHPLIKYLEKVKGMAK